MALKVPLHYEALLMDPGIRMAGCLESLCRSYSHVRFVRSQILQCYGPSSICLCIYPYYLLDNAQFSYDGGFLTSRTLTPHTVTRA